MKGINNLCSNVNKKIHVEKGYEDLTAAARAFLQSEELEAEKIINKILEGDVDHRVKSFAQEILLSILFWQGRYSEIEELSLISEEKRNLVMSIMGFYNNMNYKIIDNGEKTIMNMPKIMERLPGLNLKINDKEVDLLFDTGSMVTVLSDEVAKLCDVTIDGQENTLEGQGATGNILNPTPGHIKNIKIAGIEIENKACLILPSQMLEFGANEGGKIRQIHGTIGWDIIKDFKWTIDLGRREIIVESSKPTRSVKNMSCDFYPMINVLYEDKNMCLGLDTGANNTVFRRSMASGLGNMKKSNIEVYSAGSVIQEEGFIIPEMDLNINGKLVKISNATVREELHNNTNNFILPGVLASDIGKDKRMVIDFPNRLFSLYDA